MQRQILTKLREHERDIDREVEEVIAERRRCREVMVSGAAAVLVVVSLQGIMGLLCWPAAYSWVALPHAP